MREEFLHFIWRFQYFDKKELKSTLGELVNVLYPGTSNDDAGPDFSDAKIVMQEITWHGHIEIHLSASDWDNHHHQNNPAYDNVILHVVWEEDKKVYRNDGSLMPTIELKNRTDPSVRERFELLMENPHKIPCASSFHAVNKLIRLTMLEKVLMQRLNNKYKNINKLFVQRGNDWEETAYALLAKNFGFKINGMAFLHLSEVLPLKILLKHRNSRVSLEALLFGQAGFLDQPIKESYFLDLKKEHLFLSKKYEIYQKRLPLMEWKFLRLRPANFPSFRIAQFAALIHQHGSLFSLMLSVTAPQFLLTAFDLTPSPYWKNHVNFGKISSHKFSGIGKESINNILINTVVPLQVAYGKFIDQQSYIDNAINLLQQTPAESNNIIKQWRHLGLGISHAFDSQASIELYTNYCMPRQCLSCSIGVNIIKKGQEV